jgi:TolB-like protein/DNA-binding winged helix-turn-helix (wHTH) protein/Flp pilus assembly protein TadD
MPQAYRFEPYVLEVSEHRLRCGDREVPLPPKAFATLVFLVQRHGHLVKKNELLDAVWADVAVTEGVLALRIKEIRQALGDDAQNPRFIKTIPTVGYKFLAGVQEIGEAGQQETQIPPTFTPPDRRWRPSRKALVSILGTVAIVGVIAATYAFRAGRVAPAAIQSLAVLPFKPLVRSDRDEALEMGMTDSLITRLNGTKQLVVRQLNAVRNYNSLEQDAVAAGREQGVDAVLDGSIQRSGDRIRVTVRLVRVEDEKQLWAGQFDETFTDVLTVQDSISKQVADALALKLSGQEQSLLTKHETRSSEAYQAYVLGRYFWDQGTEEGLAKGIAHFQDAIGKDPTYALAHAGLADCYVQQGFFGVLPMAESYRRARASAERALQIDDRLGEAHVSMGKILADHYWEWDLAEMHFKRASELIPNDESAHSFYSQTLARAGRFEEAIREATRALAIAPASRRSNHSLAFAYYFAGRYLDAIEQSKSTLQLDPNLPVAHALRGLTYVQLRRNEDAIASIQKAGQLFKTPDFLALSGYVHGMTGDRKKARSVLAELRQLSRTRHVPSFDLAMVYTGLGEKQLALESLERAFQERAWELGQLEIDPMFEPLRADPQFVDLARRVRPGRQQLTHH